jgi:hypothetical protein
MGTLERLAAAMGTLERLAAAEGVLERLAAAGGDGLEDALAAALRSRWRRRGEENELGGDIFDLGFRSGVYIPQTKKSRNLSHRTHSIAV